jgi:hypothetical protein
MALTLGDEIEPTAGLDGHGDVAIAAAPGYANLASFRVNTTMSIRTSAAP